MARSLGRPTATITCPEANWTILWQGVHFTEARCEYALGPIRHGLWKPNNILVITTTLTSIHANLQQQNLGHGRKAVDDSLQIPLE